MGLRQDIADLQANNLVPKDANFSFAFGAADTAAIAVLLGLEGILKHFYLEIPSNTNSEGMTASIKNVYGKTIWTATTQAHNANYRLEVDDVNWQDQVLMGNETLVMTPGGAPGAGGCTVLAYLRAFG